MLPLFYTYAISAFYVFSVGIALIGVKSDNVGANDIIAANAVRDYSYVNSRDNNNNQGIHIARCLSGQGFTGIAAIDDYLGGWYFNGTEIPFLDYVCNDPASFIIQSEISWSHEGVMDIVKCRPFTTDAEGIYTCTIVNSSLVNDSVRIGVYFDVRSKLLDKYMHSIALLHTFHVTIIL